jgi:hypothetical protein
MSYCQRQTDWQADGEQRLVTLAASLATKHEPVINRLRELKRTKIASWTPGMLKEDGAELLLFLRQHKHACDALLAGSGIAGVAAEIRKLRPSLEAEHLDVRRAWLGLGSSATDGVSDLEAEEPEWPVFVLIRRETPDESERTTFKVRLIWVTSAFASHVDIEVIRKTLEEVFPELARRKSRNVRRITYGTQLDARSAALLAIDLATKLDEGLRASKV